MELKNVSNEVIESMKKWIVEDKTNRFELAVGVGVSNFYYDKEEKIFINIKRDDVEINTLEEQLKRTFTFDYGDDDDADRLYYKIKDFYEGTACIDLLRFVSDKYNKDWFKKNVDNNLI